MMSKKREDTPIPKEAPPALPHPEIMPDTEPVTPVVPVEDPHVAPPEIPEKISPYDFPPPGEGLFPEVF